MLLQKEINLWLMPTASGRLRRVRLKLGMVVLLSVIMLGGFLSMLYLAVDYIHLSGNRNMASSMAARLSRDRAALILQNQALQDEVEFLKNSKSRLISYEKNIKDRLGVLRTEIESAAKMGLFTAESSASPSGSSKKDVGGAEIDCQGLRCDAFKDDISSLIHEELLTKRGEDLLSTLDKYVDVLDSIPVGNPGTAFINSGFGMRVSPFSGTWRVHEGVDYALPIGTQIFATGAGVVKSVVRHKTYGLMIDVEHSDRVSTRFAHLSGVMVKPGQKVCRGQAIGYVGSSGHSTGPHLHYEVRIDGKPQNPSRLIELAERLSAAMKGGWAS